MNWQEFEENLKNRVDGHETPLDTDALWDKVRPRKRRRLLLFWWFLGGAGLLLAGYWFAGKNNAALHAGAATAAEMEAPVAAHKKPAPPVAEQPAKPSSPDTGKHGSFIPTHLNGPAESSESGKSKSLQPKGAAEKDRQFSIDAPFVLEPHLVANLLSPKNAVSLTNDPENAISGHSKPDSTLYIATNHSALNPFDIAPPYVQREDELPLALYSFGNLPSFAIPAQPVHPRFQIGLQSGVSYWNILQPTLPDPTLPRTGERRLEAFHIGLHYQAALHKRWMFRAGIEYVRYNSVFKWQKSSVAAGQDEQVINQHIDGSVDTAYLPGALIQSNRTVRHFNRVASFTLPVDLKFRIPTRHIVFMPFVGLQPGFQTASGVILDEQGRPDYSVFPHVYQRRFNLGLRAGVTMEWSLNGRYSFFLEPAGAVDLISRTARFNPEYEQFWKVGLNMGVLRTF